MSDEKVLWVCNWGVPNCNSCSINFIKMKPEVVYEMEDGTRVTQVDGTVWTVDKNNVPIKKADGNLHSRVKERLRPVGMVRAAIDLKDRIFESGTYRAG